ncbi:hypothetical protein KSP40_PGU002053 [Platanthera guangdongensis]|uniref:Uncharacterized protein n=1 Tax=Platanthera guangdongensis TaxID=2320717 RepID=A0ABR2MJT3_9ASPA
MGSCFSISSSAAPFPSGEPPTAANVINPDGSLTEYFLPTKVVDVLGTNQRLYFLCNADQLFYGYHIPALDASHVIELGKLYFLLPTKKLNYPVTVTEMAALASNASFALAAAGLMRAPKMRSHGRSRGRKGVQVLPAIAADFNGYQSFNENGARSWRRESILMRKNSEVKERHLRRGRNEVKMTTRLNVILEVPE